MKLETWRPWLPWLYSYCLESNQHCGSLETSQYKTKMANLRNLNLPSLPKSLIKFVANLFPLLFSFLEISLNIILLRMFAFHCNFIWSELCCFFQKSWISKLRSPQLMKLLWLYCFIIYLGFQVPMTLPLAS